RPPRGAPILFGRRRVTRKASSRLALPVRRTCEQLPPRVRSKRGHYDDHEDQPENRVGASHQRRNRRLSVLEQADRSRHGRRCRLTKRPGFELEVGARYALDASTTLRLRASTTASGPDSSRAVPGTRAKEDM